MSEKMDEVLDHDYDGIREYDNPMPGWWVGLFWITIVFSACYFVWYHAPVEGRSIYDNYTDAKVAELKARAKEFGARPPLEATAQQWADWSVEEKFVQYGQAIFRTNCVSCHGNDATGLVGPNLTDDKWKNVKVVNDVSRVIINGANNNAMPKMGGASLSELDVSAVSAYVISLRSQPKPGGKVLPEEVVIPAWPAGVKRVPATTQGK